MARPGVKALRQRGVRRAAACRSRGRAQRRSCRAWPRAGARDRAGTRAGGSTARTAARRRAARGDSRSSRGLRRAARWPSCGGCCRDRAWPVISPTGRDSLPGVRCETQVGRKLRDSWRTDVRIICRNSVLDRYHPHVMSGGQAPLDSFSAGTLAGAGCFRCGTCGFAVALHERDEVPACPHCGGEDFARSSIFGELALREPSGAPEVETPDWLAEAREALEHDGDWLAYDEDGQLRVIGLEAGWTRIGRSLSADLRFDDPTVSRRHAMVHQAEEGVTRVLDDRSLNGVF